MQVNYTHNRGLCVRPSKACNEPKIMFEYSFESGFIIGYVASFVSFITIFMSYCVPWMDVKKSSKLMMARKNNERKETDEMSKLPSVEYQEEENEEISVLEKFVARIGFEDISRTTDNFNGNNVIGSGKMGTVYKATFLHGWYLAVLRLHDSQQFEEQFMSELNTLARLRHVNIVPLLGFCIESKERLLVYKYMPNGNLYNWLHTMNGSAITDWPLRIKVAIGLARGLAWLHHSCNFRVVHLNISSKYILLDDSFEPKSLNFGRAMVLNQSFTINRQFWERDFVKKDVYKFGVVLLELITGKEPSKMENSSISYDESLDYWITRLSVSTSGVYDAIDRSLIGRGFDGDIFQLLKVACDCVQPFPERRPNHA